MNIYDKIRSFCKKFRIAIGVIILALGFVFAGVGEFYNLWFALGIIPLVAGLADFCPICIITKKCSLKTTEEK